MAANLEHDIRVSEERADAARLDWTSLATFESSHNEYFQTAIQNASAPDFTLDHNKTNIVYKAGLPIGFTAD